MITASAILSDFDGKIHTGHRHHNVIRNLAQKGFPKPIKGVQGFVDENGKFYNRKEAAHHVIEVGQKLVDGERFNPDKLFSENLY